MASCGYSLLVGGPCGTSSFSTPRMGNVLQSASVAKMSTITSCIAKSSDDIAVDSESKLLLSRAGRWSPFRHYTSSETNFSLDIFQNVIGIFILWPRHRDLFGTRWRCNKWRCSIPTSQPQRLNMDRKRRIQPML